ncbi:MAG: hypothetical protein AB7V42_11975 [Thermoleophilia bacterium]
MSVELEDRLRAGRPSAPEPAPEARARARAAALAALAAAPAPPPPRPRVRVALRWALGALGVLALGALFLTLLVAGRGGGEAPPAGLRFADRPASGVAMRLTVAPATPEMTPAEAVARTIAVIRARAEAMGIDGVLAEPGTGDTVELWVPVARESGGASDLFGGVVFQVYDLGRDELARERTAAAALDAVAGLDPGAPRAYYLVDARAQGHWAAGPERSADALPARGDRQRVVSIPADALLLWDPRNREYVISRARPLLGPTDVVGVAAAGDGAAFELSPAGAGRLAAARAEPGATDRLAIVREAAPDEGLPMIDGPATFAASAARLIEPTAPRWTDPFLWRSEIAGGSLPAVATVAEERPTGPAPERLGDPVPLSDLPAGLVEGLEHLPRSGAGRERGPIDPTTVRRVVSRAQPGLGVTTVYTLRTTGGASFVIDTSAKADSAGLLGGGKDPCPLRPRTPLMTPCGGGSTGPPPYLYQRYGRLDDRVARVEVEMGDGRREAATVRNGWWLWTGWTKPVRLIAIDAAGTTLGEQPYDRT